MAASPITPHASRPGFPFGPHPAIGQPGLPPQEQLAAAYGLPNSVSPITGYRPVSDPSITYEKTTLDKPPHVKVSVMYL